MSIRALVEKDDDKDDLSKTRSLPLMYDFKTQLYTLGAKPGMECMPLRSPGPYHYHHVVDQTKSLQELQNEVGALLEFRDLVIETFPDLKTKMANSQTNSTITGIPSSSSLASRREWEPGIRVRRKLPHKENSEVSSSSLVRSRSNSHSGKKEPKSGEGNGSVVQDSGFSTETSSSKETHSASSTSGAVQGTANTHRLTLDTESDELWNLLDVIHRKSNRLRDEVETLRNIERQRCGSAGALAVATGSPGDVDRASTNAVAALIAATAPSGTGSTKSTTPLVPITTTTTTMTPTITFQAQMTHASPDDVQVLRKERDRLLDKLSEMEAETLTSKIKESQLHDEMGILHTTKRDLEEQLKVALSQKFELNSKLNDLQLQFVNNNSNSCDVLSPPVDGSNSNKGRYSTATTPFSATSSRRTSESQSGATTTTTTTTMHPQHPLKFNANAYFTPVVLRSAMSSTKSSVISSTAYIVPSQDAVSGGGNSAHHHHQQQHQTNIPKVREIRNSKKIAAILLETNIVELQRNLLTITVQNQVLQDKLDKMSQSKIFLSKQLDKSKEDIEDLRFQLEEKSIELEGARAQLRVIESKSMTKSEYGSPEHMSRSAIVLPPVVATSNTQISTPSMKAMIPLAMDDAALMHHSSSTESAQDNTERRSAGDGGGSSSGGMDTPRRRPSKIPLQKTYVAPKPPIKGKNPSGPPSSRSLSKSTGSLTSPSGRGGEGRSSGPSSITTTTTMTTTSTATVVATTKQSPSRSDSSQSWRGGATSFDGKRSSSIPVSSTGGSGNISHTKGKPGSPVRTKRDSLTTRVKNLDSLSRMQQLQQHQQTTTTSTSSSHVVVTNPSLLSQSHTSSRTSFGASSSSSPSGMSSSPKGTASSISLTRKRHDTPSAASVRRVSSASVSDSDTAKVRSGLRSTFWNWLKI